MILVDHSGQIVLINDEATRLFGYKKEEFSHLTVETLGPEADREAHLAFREEFKRSPEKRFMGEGRELYGRKKGGRLIPIEVVLNPLWIQNESYVLASVLDISNRKAVENERLRLLRKVQRVNQQLVHRNKELKALASTLSHDLKGPLGSIRMYAKMAGDQSKRNWRNDQEETGAPDPIQSIEATAQRLSELVDKLLELSRFGQEAMNIENLNLNEVVRQAISVLGCLEITGEYRKTSG